MLSKKGLIIVLSFIFLLIGCEWQPAGSVAQASLVQITNGDPDPVDPNTLFTSIGFLSSGVLFFTALLKKWWKTKDFLTILISGLVSIALSLVGWLMKVGIFSGVEWWYILLYGAITMLVANGLSTWGFISSILTFFKLKVPER